MNRKTFVIPPVVPQFSVSAPRRILSQFCDASRLMSPHHQGPLAHKPSLTVSWAWHDHCNLFSFSSFKIFLLPTSRAWYRPALHIAKLGSASCMNHTTITNPTPDAVRNTQQHSAHRKGHQISSQWFPAPPARLPFYGPTS